MSYETEPEDIHLTLTIPTPGGSRKGVLSTPEPGMFLVCVERTKDGLVKAEMARCVYGERKAMETLLDPFLGADEITVELGPALDRAAITAAIADESSLVVEAVRRACAAAAPGATGA